MRVISSLNQTKTPVIAALGNFDGVHLGHQQVIAPIVARSLTLKNHYPTVVTFNPHPQEFFSGQPKSLLTPLDEKVKQLELLGIEQLVLLPFDRELAALSPKQFVHQLLVEQLKIVEVNVGIDFRFGSNRSGTVHDLQAIANSVGIKVNCIPLYKYQEERISSSIIRTALVNADLQKAHRLLGRKYSLTGKVIEGKKLGRTIGFPTANLELPKEKFLPKFGVYCVLVNIANHIELVPGVMNIGYRPTLELGQSVEVHLLNWVESLYGQILTVSLEQFLRPEQKFNSIDQLASQIKTDCHQAREYFGLA